MFLQGEPEMSGLPSGKLWKIIIFNGKTMGKPWENGDLYGKIHHFVAGTIHSLTMAIFQSFFVCLPGGNPAKMMVKLWEIINPWR